MYFRDSREVRLLCYVDTIVRRFHVPLRSCKIPIFPLGLEKVDWKRGIPGEGKHEVDG